MGINFSETEMYGIKNCRDYIVTGLLPAGLIPDSIITVDGCSMAGQDAGI